MKTAGIDVSHKTVTLTINRAGRVGKPHDFKNTAQGASGPDPSRAQGPGEPRLPGGHGPVPP